MFQLGCFPMVKFVPFLVGIVLAAGGPSFGPRNLLPMNARMMVAVDMAVVAAVQGAVEAGGTETAKCPQMMV